MGHLHMKRQGLQPTKEKLLIQTCNTRFKNVVFFTTVDPIPTKDGSFYSYICGHLPTTSSRRHKYIHVIYVYDYNTILSMAMKNRSDKEMIPAFTELTEDIKSIAINPGFHFMDNETYIALNMAMASMDIKY